MQEWNKNFNKYISLHNYFLEIKKKEIKKLIFNLYLLTFSFDLYLIVINYLIHCLHFSRYFL